MSEPNPEELERIKLEEIKKIEEIERENFEKKEKLQQELKKLQESKPGAKPVTQSEDFDRVREEIRRREMIARGFIQFEGQWVQREEAEKLLTEKEEKQRLEDEKVTRAKQRKIERERSAYEELMAANIIHIRVYSILTYIGLALSLIGLTLSIVATNVKSLMTAFFFPGMVATLAGLIVLGMFSTFLIDLESKLMEKAFFVLDGERFEFEDESEIKDPARRAARAMARHMYSRLRKEENS